MAVYIVSYDLRMRRDYPGLYDVLETYEAVSILESIWAIDSADSAADIRDTLKAAIDEDDGLFVIEAKKHWAARKIENADWLKSSSRSW